MWHESPNDIAALDGLKRGLKAMGMGEGLVELRAKGNKVKAKKLLVQAKKKGVDLFVALGTKSAQIIQAWEKKIPIVFTAVTNPVLSRITSSWTGSKKNIAGNSNWLDRKEMLRAFRLALPSLKNLLVLKSPGNSVSSAEISEARKAMKALPNLMLTELEIRDARTVGKTLGKNLAGVDAIWIPIDFPLYQEAALSQIVQEAGRERIPIFSSTLRCAGRGAIVVSAVDYQLLGLKASALVRDILVHGVNPGSIPIGRMKSFRLFVDLGAARRINLKLPFELILGAHRLFGAEVKK